MIKFEIFYSPCPPSNRTNNDDSNNNKNNNNNNIILYAVRTHCAKSFKSVTVFLHRAKFGPRAKQNRKWRSWPSRPSIVHTFISLYIRFLDLLKGLIFHRRVQVLLERVVLALGHVHQQVERRLVIRAR